MSKKKKIIISVIAAVLIIAVIVSAVVIAMTKEKNAAKASGVYANKVADVMYQAGSTDKYFPLIYGKNTGMRYSCALVHQIMICWRFPIQLPIRQRALHTDTGSMGQTYI